MPILEIEALTKKYGEATAVDRISFQVEAGETVGLLGPNGAGKTTTIQMLLGLLEPTSGQIRVLGKSFLEHRHELLAEMNFSATYASLPGNLTVRENLNVFARLYGVSLPEDRVDKVIDIFDLRKFSKTRSGHLSSGEQSRLLLAKAFLNSPRILLLDEPTSSLDPDMAERIRATLKREAGKSKSAVLWTSHNMYEVETVCDRVLFLSHGKILDSGTPKELVSRHGTRNLEETFIKLAREPLDGKMQPGG